jgi:hypothetical protein
VGESCRHGLAPGAPTQVKRWRTWQPCPRCGWWRQCRRRAQSAS